MGSEVYVRYGYQSKYTYDLRSCGTGRVWKWKSENVNGVVLELSLLRPTLAANMRLTVAVLNPLRFRNVCSDKGVRDLACCDFCRK